MCKLKYFSVFVFLFLLGLENGFCQVDAFDTKPKYAPRGEKHRNKTDDLGRKQGLWKHYNLDSDLTWEVEYLNDKRNGISKRFYANNKIMRETEYQFGIKDGSFKRYDYNGTILTEGEYDLGKKSSQWTNFYTNGQTRSEGQYIKGLKDGEWKYYNRRGDLVNTIMFRNGKDMRDIQLAEKKAADAKKAIEAKKAAGSKSTKPVPNKTITSKK